MKSLIMFALFVSPYSLLSQDTLRLDLPKFVKNETVGGGGKYCKCYTPDGKLQPMLKENSLELLDSCITYFKRSYQAYREINSGKVLINSYKRKGEEWQVWEYDLQGNIVSTYKAKSLYPSDKAYESLSVYSENEFGEISEENYLIHYFRLQQIKSEEDH